MKKIILMLISITTQAQTFDFNCDNLEFSASISHESFIEGRYHFILNIDPSFGEYREDFLVYSRFGIEDNGEFDYGSFSGYNINGNPYGNSSSVGDGSIEQYKRQFLLIDNNGNEYLSNEVTFTIYDSSFVNRNVSVNYVSGSTASITLSMEPPEGVYIGFDRNTGMDRGFAFAIARELSTIPGEFVDIVGYTIVSTTSHEITLTSNSNTTIRYRALTGFSGVGNYTEFEIPWKNN